MASITQIDTDQIQDGAVTSSKLAPNLTLSNLTLAGGATVTGGNLTVQAGATFGGNVVISGTLTVLGAVLEDSVTIAANNTLTVAGTLTSNAGAFTGSWAGTPTFQGMVTFAGGFTLLDNQVANISGTIVGGTISGTTLQAVSLQSGVAQGVTWSGGTMLGTWAGNPVFGGTPTFTNTVSFPNGLLIEPFQASGTWIDLPTAGPSAIGVGGVGNNALLAYVSSAGSWFADAQGGDVAYRNTSGRLLWGTNGNDAALRLSGASTDALLTLNLASYGNATALGIAGTPFAISRTGGLKTAYNTLDDGSTGAATFNAPITVNGPGTSTFAGTIRSTSMEPFQLPVLSAFPPTPTTDGLITNVDYTLYISSGTAWIPLAAISGTTAVNPTVGYNWGNNQTLGAQGVATSGQNYGSYGWIYDYSEWNGTSAQTESWSTYVDASGRFSIGWGNLNQGPVPSGNVAFQVDPSGNAWFNQAARFTAPSAAHHYDWVYDATSDSLILEYA